MHKMINETGKVYCKQGLTDYFHGLFDAAGQTTARGFWYGMLGETLIYGGVLLVFILLTCLAQGPAHALNHFIAISLFIGELPLCLLLECCLVPLVIRRLRDIGLKANGIVLVFIIITVLNALLVRNLIIVAAIINIVLFSLPSNWLQKFKNKRYLRPFIKD